MQGITETIPKLFAMLKSAKEVGQGSHKGPMMVGGVPYTLVATSAAS